MLPVALTLLLVWTGPYGSVDISAKIFTVAQIHYFPSARTEIKCHNSLFFQQKTGARRCRGPWCIAPIAPVLKVPLDEHGN